jgi:phenylalanyl-tRNA synthetase alpha chain
LYVSGIVNTFNVRNLLQTVNVQELNSQLEQLEQAAVKALNQAADAASLEEIRLAYLGGKGEITTLLKSIAALGKDERPAVGKIANRVKEAISTQVEQRKNQLYEQELAARLTQTNPDPTLPGVRLKLGHLHPLTQVMNDICNVFYGMGFSVGSFPEIETEYYNFDALNFLADHPARDSQDTFFTSAGKHVVLRSHTSNMQIRTMENNKPPFRVVEAGRVYRNEEVNARKYPIFHQIEGLLVDKNVTLGDLKGTLNEFIRVFFGRPLKTRFRPDFFPFTEPSAELDSQCPFCGGEGCRTCGHRGWLELLGCGMVDPAVLSNCGIDPEVWSGFAFGMGIDRLVMLKYNINDIRSLFSGDMRFLEQF